MLFIDLLGIAFWGKVETSNPSYVYYFGPYFSRSGLRKDLVTFRSELTNEGASISSVVILRQNCPEPLTHSIFSNTINTVNINSSN